MKSMIANNSNNKSIDFERWRCEIEMVENFEIQPKISPFHIGDESNAMGGTTPNIDNGLKPMADPDSPHHFTTDQ